MTRAAVLATLVILSGVLASSGVACESSHRDQNFGSEAGADYDAPAREVNTDGGADDAS